MYNIKTHKVPAKASGNIKAKPLTPKILPNIPCIHKPIGGLFRLTNPDGSKDKKKKFLKQNPEFRF